MSDLSQSLADRLLSAQSVNGIPPSEPMVPYPHIGALLQERVDRDELKPFLIFYGEETPRIQYSYHEFYEEVCRAANYLQRCGVRPGDRVATISSNHADVVVQYFAAFLLGAVIVPINTGEDDRRITYVLDNSGATLAFVRDDVLDRIKGLRPHLSQLRTIVQVGKRLDPDLPHYQSELLKASVDFTPTTVPALSDEAVIVYTSGTTGSPKGVVLTQYNLLVDAMAIAEWHRISDDQRMMCVLPLHHVNGLVVTLLTPLYAGGGVVLNQKFHPDKFFERISTERVNVVSVVPTILQYLLHTRLVMDAYKLAHFRHIICGAGPLTAELAAKFEQEFKIPIIHGYGLSETTCYSCFLPIDLTPRNHKAWLSKYGFPSIGVALPVNELAIHDEHGHALPEGEKGEIVVRGHNVMKYYFKNQEINEQTFAHGWFRSGDEGFFRYDEEGRMFFFITGRLKELIIRGGVNISPFEIDEVLMSMPGIRAAIAVGFENDWYGEEVGAYVALKEGVQLSEHEVAAYCRKHLPYMKSPKVVLFGSEIPVTSTGKYQRSRCEELFQRWKAVQFTEHT